MSAASTGIVARARIPILPGALSLVAGVTVAYGLWQRLVAHRYLGTKLSPFVMEWAPSLHWGAVAAVLVWAAAPAMLTRAAVAIRSRAAFAGLSYGAMLLLGLSLNAARMGIPGWWRVFVKGPGGSHEAGFEYLPGLPALSHGVHAYLAGYPQLLAGLPTHAKGNPPGTLLAIDLLGLTTPARLALGCILLGALVAPLTYALGRVLGGEDRGRRAALLACCSPALQLFGVTSVDYVFAALGTATVWLLLSDPTASGSRGRLPFLAGCALAALSSLASWLLLAMPVGAALVAALCFGPRRGLTVAVGGFAGIALLNLGLWLWQGYDPVAVVRALGPIYAHGAAAQRPYGYWLFGSPVAWAAFLGIPVAWMAARAAADRDPAALALAILIVISAVLGFTKAETERIWLPFVPLACAAAAARPTRRLPSVLAAMALQAVVVEILFDTIW